MSNSKNVREQLLLEAGWRKLPNGRWLRALLLQVRQAQQARGRE